MHQEIDEIYVKCSVLTALVQNSVLNKQNKYNIKTFTIKYIHSKKTYNYYDYLYTFVFPSEFSVRRVKC
jgi:hypothetical protein